jgi:YHS domain-containing protein
MQTTTRRRLPAVLLLLAFAPLIAVLGCTSGRDTQQGTAVTDNKSAATPSSSPTAAATDAEADHAHKPGAHGGLIVSIGLDSYHAEALVEQGGTLKLLMLGQDESRILEVEKQTLKAYVKAAGSASAIPIDVMPVPQDGDADGSTSQFVARLPEELQGKELDITIPNIRIKGERFRIGFTTRQEQHESGHGSVPAGVASNEETQLYLTPGGKYTVADIQANGNKTASQKFEGIASNHDLKPKVGDRICPVTLTKANPDFTWVIDGQKYQFCCPPCVDEYLTLAKTKPEELQPADSFVKK